MTAFIICCFLVVWTSNKEAQLHKEQLVITGCVLHKCVFLFVKAHHRFDPFNRVESRDSTTTMRRTKRRFCSTGSSLHRFSYLHVCPAAVSSALLLGNRHAAFLLPFCKNDAFILVLWQTPSLCCSDPPLLFSESFWGKHTLGVSKFHCVTQNTHTIRIRTHRVKIQTSPCSAFCLSEGCNQRKREGAQMALTDLCWQQPYCLFCGGIASLSGNKHWSLQ